MKRRTTRRWVMFFALITISAACYSMGWWGLVWAGPFIGAEVGDRLGRLFERWSWERERRKSEAKWQAIKEGWEWMDTIAAALDRTLCPAAVVKRLQAALRHRTTGFLVAVSRPYRHAQALAQARSLGWTDDSEQGFYDPWIACFYTREEAAAIFVAAGHTPKHPPKLYTEDLWTDEP